MSLPTDKGQLASEDRLLSTFKKTGPIIIFGPIVLVLLVFLAKLTNPESMMSKKPENNIRISPTTVNIVSTVSPIAKTSTESAVFNLKGPLKCAYSYGEDTITAYVKDFQLYVAMPNKGEKERILLKGDCVYNWDEGEVTGKKMCGVGQYVVMFQSLSATGSISPDIIIDSLSKMQPSGPDIDARKLVNACVKEEVNESVFALPQSINFVEEELQP